MSAHRTPRVERTTVPGFDPVIYARLMAHFHALPSGAGDERWLLLEAAHVVGQTRFVPHFETHGRMLQLAWRRRDWREVAGQALRLLLVPLGHLSGRLPIGNPGSASVSAFRPMALRPDIAQAIALASLR
jgi:hypothetical protein